MSKHKKTIREIASSFYVSRAEISKLLGCGRVFSSKAFDMAQSIDKEELGINYIDFYKVRLSSVLKAAGITKDDLERCIKVGSEQE